MVLKKIIGYKLKYFSLKIVKFSFYLNKKSKFLSISILDAVYEFPILLTTIDDNKDAINKETDGLILFFKRTLNIANIESPAPILSKGLKLNEGQEYFLSL